MAESKDNLVSHLSIKDENRNQVWDERFFKLLSETSLKILSQDPQQGPDGWPYIMTQTLAPAEVNLESDEESIDTAQKIFYWLANRGIGMVVNPNRLPYPDFVLSYGMIWSFRETGFFMKFQNEINQSKKLQIDENSKLVSGEPTQEFLPNYVRKVLKDFFRDQSVFDPKVLMISTDQINYDLCFSLESLGNPKVEEHDGVLEALAWFLPPHYSLALISEKNLPAFISI
ncbi:MAG: hypothetical protein WA160_16470 [Pseudobdellovibrio sp.]